MSFFSSALLAASMLFQTQAPVPEKKIFTPLISFENYALSVNIESIAILGNRDNPLVGLDMELVMVEPLKSSDQSKTPIKSFVNTVVADCRSDTLYVVVSRGFDVGGSLVFSSADPITIAPKPFDITPARLILNFTCKPIEKIERDKIKPSLPAKGITV